MKKLIPQKLRNIYHLAQAALANLIYGFPSQKINIIGVTGTNGKTTTCQMIAKILEEAGKKVAMATTINFKVGDKEWVNATKLTTLSSFAVQRFISQAVDAGCEYLILETSSHSLDQNRVWGVKYDTAVITNVTREHLDYHETMERYREVKKILFRKVKTAVVNLDMEKPEDFISCKSKLKFGFTTSSSTFHVPSSNKIQSPNGHRIIRAEEINSEIDHTSFKIPGFARSGEARQDTIFKLNIPGLFNVENALAAICVGLTENISLEICAKALEKIKSIPGRVEWISNNKNLNIIIDYAVTPDSLEKLYELIDQIKGHPKRSEPFRDSLPAGRQVRSAQNDSKVISIFGSCGERDRGKRPMMGEVVSRYADYIIITNEDPYNEEPWQIINEVASGIPICHSDRSEESRGSNSGIPRQARDDVFCFTENVNFWKIMDRRGAIGKALAIAKPGDYIIITGKGAEETMAIGKKRIPWNDKKVILKELEKV